MSDKHKFYAVLPLGDIAPGRAHAYDVAWQGSADKTSQARSSFLSVAKTMALEPQQRVLRTATSFEVNGSGRLRRSESREEPALVLSFKSAEEAKQFRQELANKPSSDCIHFILR